MLSERDKNILIQVNRNGFPLTPRPFAEIADALSLTETEVMDAVMRLRKEKIVRALRAVVNIRSMGYCHNCLVAWKAPKEKLLVIASSFTDNPLVSHVYEREPQPDFNFNLFTMVHSSLEKDIRQFVEITAKQWKIEYEMLFTKRELKKIVPDIGVLLSHGTQVV